MQTSSAEHVKLPNSVESSLLSVRQAPGGSAGRVNGFFLEMQGAAINVKRIEVVGIENAVDFWSFHDGHLLE